MSKTSILVLVIICLFLARPYVDNSVEVESVSNQNTVPNVIWSYWNSEDIPKIVQISQNALRKHNPDYEVILITPKTLSLYVDQSELHPSFSSKSPAHQSDIIRMVLLCKFGGCWVDASMLWNKSIDDMFKKKQHVEFSGFYISKYSDSEKVIENWFIRCSPNSKFIKLWKKEFYEAMNHKVLYVLRHNHQRQKISLQSTLYLTQHLCALSVLSKHPELKRNFELYEAEKTAFSVFVEFDWDSEKIIHYLQSKESKNHNLDVVKLRGCDRKFLNYQTIHPDSFIGQMIR